VLGEAGDSVEWFFKSGVSGLKQKLGPILWQFAETKKFDPEDFERFLNLLPRDVEKLPLRHVLEVRHASFKCEEFVAMARKFGVAVVVAGDSVHPLIPDPTTDFVYLRIMGTEAKEEKGYSPDALDEWTERAKTYAAGSVPADLPSIASPGGQGAERDVFIFVINGFKQSNPAAAMALIERLSG
jgi:uncharacterized protein YecE (DUF72 family)